MPGDCLTLRKAKNSHYNSNVQLVPSIQQRRIDIKPKVMMKESKSSGQLHGLASPPQDTWRNVQPKDIYEYFPSQHQKAASAMKMQGKQQPAETLSSAP